MAGGETENGRKARMAGMQMDRCGILNRMKNGGIHTAPESIVYDSGAVLCTPGRRIASDIRLFYQGTEDIQLCVKHCFDRITAEAGVNGILLHTDQVIDGPMVSLGCPLQLLA